MLESEVREKRRGVGRVQLRDLELDLRAHRHRQGGRTREKRRKAGPGGRFLDAAADLGHVGLVEVDHQEQRFGCQQLEAAQSLEVLAGQVERAQRRPVFERVLAARQQIAFLLEVGRLGFLQVLVEPLEPSFDHAKVGQNQLVFHRLRIARRVDRLGDVGHRLVGERPHDVNQCVGVLVGDHVHQRPGAPARAGQIGELDRGRRVFLGGEHRREPVESGIGDFGDPNLHLSPALCRPSGLADGRHELKERGFAGGRQSDQCSAKHGNAAASPCGRLVGGPNATC